MLARRLKINKCLIIISFEDKIHVHVIDSLDYTNKFIVVVCVCVFFGGYMEHIDFIFLKIYKILFNKSFNAL